MFATMSVRTRLLAGFMIVTLLGALVAGIGVFNMARMNAQAEQAYKSDLIGISSLKEANINMVYIGRDMRSRLLSLDPAIRAKSDAAVDQARKDMRIQLDIARPLFRSEQGRAMFCRYRPASDDLRRPFGHLARDEPRRYRRRPRRRHGFPVQPVQTGCRPAR